VKKERERKVLAYIGLGSNLGDCRKNLLEAWNRLGEVEEVRLLELSSPYKTEPVGMISENWFINAVGCVETTLEPEQLLGVMQGIEISLGRIRDENSDLPTDRSVDLDLLFWEDRISEDVQLTLPHPEIAKRLFVLEPLVEIAKDLRHPVSGKTMTQLLSSLRLQLQDQGQIPQAVKTTWLNKNTE
jgi:2-amino-4-hydroxy-6-hydroxymethyldihydropteridine diphosphokinase